DVDDAIKVHREGLKILASQQRLFCVNNLLILLTQFPKNGHQTDFDEIIKLRRETVQLHVDKDEQRAASLNNLGAALEMRFRRIRNPGDLQEATVLWREAVQILPSKHSNRSVILTNWASALVSLFRIKGNEQYLDEAIEAHRESLGLLPAPHPNRGMSLNQLALALDTRYEFKGNSDDLDEAIGWHTEALSLRTGPDANRAISLSNLGSAVLTRYQVQGDLDDLDYGIQLHTEALGLQDPPNSEPGALLNLATAIIMRFERRADPKDIDQAVEYLREVLKHCDIRQPLYNTALNNLGNGLRIRFEQNCDIEDLNEAVKLNRLALELRPAPHPSRSHSLTNLGNLLVIKADHENSRNIDEAVKLLREALGLRCAPHPEYGNALKNLAIALEIRFQQEENPQDIDEAVQLFNTALQHFPDRHPGRSDSLNNLASALTVRFSKQQDLHDIQEAIRLSREALSLSPDQHPNRGLYLDNFGSRILKMAYLRGPAPEILEVSIGALREASTYIYSSPLTRFNASTRWAEIATLFTHDSGMDAYRTSIKLLPQIAAFNLDINSRHKILSNKEITMLAFRAANYAIYKEDVEAAAEFLEASRSVFWSRSLDLRTPLDDLRKVNEDLATQLKDLSGELEKASFRDAPSRSSRAQKALFTSGDADAVRCRQLNEDWDKITKAVRELPGFHDFLLPKTMDSLRQAAVSGPVVILLTSKMLNSALIVQASGDFHHMYLPEIERKEDFSEDTSTKERFPGGPENRRKVSSEEDLRLRLGELWLKIVKPVLKVLNIRKSDNPPRIWWCPTGQFAFLPIHAAGIYNEEKAECVSDYVISSYTPTLTALLNRPTGTPTAFKVTAVIEPEAPGCGRLPGTEEELDHIRQRVPKKWLETLRSPTGMKVMTHLKESSILHFACHGIQDLVNPLDSGLMLSDGRLTLSRIIRRLDDEIEVEESQSKTMSLAFLSACETSKGDVATPDEAMHIAASLLFAGFHGVVATMWRMNDKDGPKIADAFYEYLLSTSTPDAVPPVFPDLTTSPRALHHAVAKLRKEPGIGLRRWMPFVHYG
ncbi:CHAT domain-containing protein, partial [Mycena leptocephala]